MLSAPSNQLLDLHMKKWYLANNASRRIKLGKFTLAFEIVDQFAGAWRGVYATSNPEEIQLIDAAAPRLGMTELTEEAYEALSKKATFARMRSLKQSGLRPVSTTVGGDKPAVTVAERKRLVAPSESVKQKDLPETADVLKVGVANITDNLDKPEAARRVRRKPE